MQFFAQCTGRDEDEIFRNKLKIGYLFLNVHCLNLHTTKNATDLMQVVDFTGLMQVANKLYQHNETTYIKPACSSQLAASLLTTCNRLVTEQAMRTHVFLAVYSECLHVGQAEKLLINCIRYKTY